MATLHIDKNRQVVPRWRRFVNGVLRGETAPESERPQAKFDSNTIQQLLADWRENPGMATAGDLLSVCVTLGLEDKAKEAVDYLLKYDDVPAATAQLAQAIAIGSSGWQLQDEYPGLNAIRAEIALEKHRLRYFPHDPYRWADLSRLYVTIGQTEKSRNAMRVALSLAPENRFVVRAATRLFLHLEEPDLAHRLLKDSPLVKVDPWILSAEIATAAATGHVSDLIVLGRRTLEKNRFAPFHLSELASALGTIQINSGSLKKGRKLIKRSLQMPSENALAQAAWLARDALTYEQLGETPSHEANAWLARREGNWKEVVKSSTRWLGEQPFSTRPAALGSFAAVLTGDYETASEIAWLGLQANPGDFLLKNNRAFALARMGQPEDAAALLRDVDAAGLSKEEKIVHVATLGMIAFRRGDPDAGRRHYLECIFAATLNDSKKAAVAAMYRAEQEIRIGSDYADQAVADARRLADESPEDSYVKQLRSRFESMLDSESQFDLNQTTATSPPLLTDGNSAHVM